MARAEAPAAAAPTDARHAQFPVMGSTAVVTVVGGHRGHLHAAEARLRDLDALWSRFRPDSDVGRLNAAGGATVGVASETVVLIDALVDAWRATGGAFDPTLLPALVGAGDGASRRGPSARSRVPADAHCPGDPAGIVVDRARATVRLPRGTTIDAGGLGKGLAADLVADELIAAGAEGALVSVGGDLRAAGHAPGGGWAVEVEQPHAAGRPLAVVDLADGGVATSTPAARHWRGPDGRRRHHLLDPATASPSTAPVASVTVAAGTAAWAEAFTKVPYALGPDAGLAALQAAGLAAVVVTDDGTTHATGVWHALARSVGAP